MDGLKTFYARRGIVSAPHALAAQSGAAVLREGGNALEAAITTAAVLAVVYPHMNGIGGDSFWLIREPECTPFVIDASGNSAALAEPGFYRYAGTNHTMPVYGPLAAATVAGTVAGWQTAYHHSRYQWQGRLPLPRLLADAVYYAEHGYAVSVSQTRTTGAEAHKLQKQPGFREMFLFHDQPPAPGTLFCQPRLAATLRYLSEAGLWDFYRGDMAHSIADDLAELGSPLRYADLHAYRPDIGMPLTLRYHNATVYGTGAPTQGVSALLMLGLFERWRTEVAACDSPAYVHVLVEAGKLAFELRNTHVHDPADMTTSLQSLLESGSLQQLAARLDPQTATAWPPTAAGGDTVWFGVIDGHGHGVSVTQSLYYPFGSGVVLPGTGICWHNRATAFNLNDHSTRRLQPRRKPLHTLCPALALLDDGRLLLYGSTGGNGQPQTQTALFTRYVDYNLDLQTTLSAPRWLLGNHWGPPSATLYLEDRFDPRVYDTLEQFGHTVEILPAFDEIMGHAGALVQRADGVLEGATDPRSDGGVAGF